MQTAPVPEQTNSCCAEAGHFLLTWTPRVAVAMVFGYYSLGVAYAWGVMATIDSIAIPIIVNWVGYAGLGAVMPTFQWYAAWSVQAIAASLGGLLYDLVERLLLFLVNQLRSWLCIAAVPPA
jgi:hypothetical protein